MHNMSSRYIKCSHRERVLPGIIAIVPSSNPFSLSHSAIYPLRIEFMKTYRHIVKNYDFLKLYILIKLYVLFILIATREVSGHDDISAVIDFVPHTIIKHIENESTELPIIHNKHR